MFQVNEEDMRPAPALTYDEGLPDPHPQIDTGIFNLSESEMELFLISMFIIPNHLRRKKTQQALHLER